MATLRAMPTLFNLSIINCLHVYNYGYQYIYNTQLYYMILKFEVG